MQNWQFIQNATGKLLAGGILAVWPALTFAQLEFETRADFAVLMDHESRTFLFQKNADAPMEPASMAKLMTVAVAYDYIDSGRLAFDDPVFISEKAWREGGATSGGSTMFAEVNSQISVGNILKSIIIQSGNDASIALAEAIGGTEDTFVRIMNDMADRLGMENSTFANSTGLPDENMRVTARDLALLAHHIIEEYPQYYDYFSQPAFEWNGISQPNRNALLDKGIGVDGLKTGHTERSGYGIVASSVENGRRLTAVLNGLQSSRDRNEEARKLLTWGSRNFERVVVFDAGEIIGDVPVYGGEKAKVALTGDGPVALYLPKGSRRCLDARLVYQGPLLPPVSAGDKIAELKVWCNNQLIQRSALFASETVEQGNLMRRSADAAKELVLGWLK